jgi:hypothetical protein
LFRPARFLRPAGKAGEIAAYEAWGFKTLSQDLADVLGIWARFINGSLLDDRARTRAPSPQRPRPARSVPGART